MKQPFALKIDHRRLDAIEDLREVFLDHQAEIVNLYLDGRLEKWCSAHGYHSEAEAIGGLSPRAEDDLLVSLSRILGIDGFEAYVVARAHEQKAARAMAISVLSTLLRKLAAQREKARSTKFTFRCLHCQQTYSTESIPTEFYCTGCHKKLIIGKVIWPPAVVLVSTEDYVVYSKVRDDISYRKVPCGKCGFENEYHPLRDTATCKSCRTLTLSVGRPIYIF